MSYSPPPEPQYEFTGQQSDEIRGLSYRMSGVGFVFLLLGMLQIASGISILINGRSPEKTIAMLAEKYKIPLNELDPATVNRTTVTVAAIAAFLVGFVHFLIGLWTRQAAFSFAAVANTRGQDITRMMEALASLKKMYGLVYNIMLIGALLMVASLGYSLFMQWKAG